MLVPERGSFGSGSTLFKEGVLGEVSSKGFVALLYVFVFQRCVVHFVLCCIIRLLFSMATGGGVGSR